MRASSLGLMDARTEAKTRRNPRGVFEKFPGSGEWWIRYNDSNGRYRREKAGSKSVAIKLVDKRRTEALQGKKLPERLRRATVTFAEIAKDALAYSKAHKRSYETDRIHMETMLTRFRDSGVGSITPTEIERYLTQTAKERDWAPATVNRHRALLSLVFRIATENNKVERNPVRLVKPRAVSNTRVRWLADGEETRLRATIEADCKEHMPELDLALNTGLRRSEMYGLTWENVNLARCVLTIPRSKNGEMRHVPLNSAALSALAELKKRGDGTGAVIRNKDREPLTGPRHWFEPAILKAKIPSFSWHCLRHTFASRLVMAGVDLRTVQELMGHKQICMTVRYAHLSPDHTLAAVQRLAQAKPSVTPPMPAQRETPTDTSTDTEVVVSPVADTVIFRQLAV